MKVFAENKRKLRPENRDALYRGLVSALTTAIQILIVFCVLFIVFSYLKTL